MKRLTFGITLLTLVLLVGSLSPKEASSKVFKLKFGVHYPVPHPMTGIMKGWIKDMETRTGGRLKIKYYPGRQLLSIKEAREKIRVGICEIGIMNPTYYPEQFPLIAVNSLPFTYTSSKQGTRVMNELTGFFNKQFEASNLRLLWGYTPPPYQAILAEKQIRTLKDWKGLRFRSAGAGQKMALRALGATPVLVAPPEVYTSLQRGTIDGAILYLGTARKSLKLHEIVKHVTVANLTTIGMTLCMNLDTWKSLPKDIQGHVMASSAVASEKASDMFVKSEKKEFPTWKKLGIKFYTPSSAEAARWKEAVRPLWDKFINENEAKGLPAKKLVEELKELAKKYQ